VPRTVSGKNWFSSSGSDVPSIRSPLDESFSTPDRFHPRRRLQWHSRSRPGPPLSPTLHRAEGGGQSADQPTPHAHAPECRSDFQMADQLARGKLFTMKHAAQKRSHAEMNERRFQGALKLS
jgi:hypothetical protein